MKPNPNLPPEHQAMQAELYGRIDAEHRKIRDAKLLRRLKVCLFAAVVLLSCIGISKYQCEQQAKTETKIESTHKSVNQ